MTTLYLIRHGQSTANIKHIIQGQSDYPLTALGEKQASLAAKYLKNIKLDAVYASDLSRAYQTADMITEPHALKPQPEEDLREVFLGPLQGRARASVVKDYPELNHRSFVTSGIPGTETFDSISMRCLNLVQKWQRDHQGETIMAVSHGGFISIFLMYLIAGDGWHHWNRPFLIENTGITKVYFDEMGQAKIHFSNNTSHLEEL
ncbi:histidine phosphatase family protein [Alkalicoccus halolimnae]|uniref:Histidine phosphatase family protein n=1 Tax=Alkalicoccus halolimnae TaxID=1667239 RepID=A0AAJ8LWL8_9BACI|nr:histidine phosphatase family protein [Alkalicoccus halolimnae]